MAENVVVRILGDAAGLQGAVGQATGAVGGLGKSTSSILSPALLGVAGAAGVAVAAIASMTMAAAADRDEQAKLEQALKASGAATGDWNAQVDQAIAKGAELAFSDSEIRAALIPLAQATGDMTQANADLAVAQDVARLAGVDLETAAKAIAKAHDGNTGALKRLVPALGDVETGTDAIAEAQRLASGQADTFAKSTEGQLKRSGDAFGELQETIGSAFLPILDEIVPVLIPIVDTLGELIKAILPVLIPLIKQVTNAFKLFVSHIRTVIDIVRKLIDAISGLLKPIQDALRGLQDLVHFDLPKFDLPSFSLPFAAPPSSGGTRARGGIVINTGADPISVVRHVRAYVSANGGL